MGTIFRYGSACKNTKRGPVARLVKTVPTAGTDEVDPKVTEIELEPGTT
jgi:hypothetical protein